MDEITDDPNIDGITSEPLRRAIGDRYLTYALSTIMHRALPDARDGFPNDANISAYRAVQRRARLWQPAQLLIPKGNATALHCPMHPLFGQF